MVIKSEHSGIIYMIKNKIMQQIIYVIKWLMCVNKYIYIYIYPEKHGNGFGGSKLETRLIQLIYISGVFFYKTLLNNSLYLQSTLPVIHYQYYFYPFLLFLIRSFLTSTTQSSSLLSSWLQCFFAAAKNHKSQKDAKTVPKNVKRI